MKSERQRKREKMDSICKVACRMTRSERISFLFALFIQNVFVFVFSCCFLVFRTKSVSCLSSLCHMLFSFAFCYCLHGQSHLLSSRIRLGLDLSGCFWKALSFVYLRSGVGCAFNRNIHCEELFCLLSKAFVISLCSSSVSSATDLLMFNVI